MNNRIAGIGANVYDTIISLDRYPDEDTKMRASAVRPAGGGPCATGLVAAAKLGAQASYIGVLSDDNIGAFLISDFKKYGVSTDCIKLVPGCSAFTSFVLLSAEKTTRTVVFDRGDLPPLTLDDRSRAEIMSAGVLMVDGNELPAAVEGAKLARGNGAHVLYDAGGKYAGVEELLPLADILIPSCEFSLAVTGKNTAEDAAVSLYEKYSPKVVTVTTGKTGGVMYDGKKLCRYPAVDAVVVDSNGAGDVFHGAFAFALTKGYNYYSCCLFASAVSALKCTGVGARSSVPDFEKTISYLKEQGYEL